MEAQAALEMFDDVAGLIIATDFLHLVCKLAKLKEEGTLGRCPQGWKHLLFQIAAFILQAEQPGRTVSLG